MVENAAAIQRALGADFDNLHPVVRRHYSERAIDIAGTMDSVYVRDAIKPLALASYKLLYAPVPYSGKNVEISLRNRVDDSGAMHWVRTFFGNDSFRKTVTFESHMVCSGEHRIIEFSRYGIGVEADLSVDAEGSLVYEMHKYVVRLPVFGLILRFPTWLSPFGGGRTTETGESETGFSVDFEMRHPLFGRTIAYTGSCRFEPS